MSLFICNSCGNKFGPCGICSKCLSKDVTKIEDSIYLQIKIESEKKE